MTIQINPHFWELIEDNKNAKYVVYGDTDSLYVRVPIEFESAETAIEKIDDDYVIPITTILDNFLNTVLLPRINVAKEYNRTNFKTETIIKSMLLMEAKKNYAYSYIAKDGKVKDGISYVGLPIKKVSISKLSKAILHLLIDDIALSDSENKMSILTQKTKELYFDLVKRIENFDIEYFGNSVKWKTDNSYERDTASLIGMKFYNTIVNEVIFRPGIAGYEIPIKLLDINTLNENLKTLRFSNEYYIGHTSLTKVSKIVIPYNFEPKEVKSLFESMALSIPIELLWDKSIGKIGKNIQSIIRSSF